MISGIGVYYLNGVEIQTSLAYILPNPYLPIAYLNKNPNIR